MNLLNLIEDANTGYDNLRALMQAVQNSQDAVLNISGEPITLTYPEARFMFGKYKAYNKAGRQEEFIADLGNPVRFDMHMKQLRQLLDKQKVFRGSVPGERGVAGDVPQGVAESTTYGVDNPYAVKPGEDFSLVFKPGKRSGVHYHMNSGMVADPFYFTLNGKLYSVTNQGDGIPTEVKQAVAEGQGATTYTVAYKDPSKPGKSYSTQVKATSTAEAKAAFKDWDTTNRFTYLGSRPDVDTVYEEQGVAEVQLVPQWQDDPEHLAYRKKQANISKNTGLTVGDRVTLKDRPGFEGEIVHDWGGGDFTISGGGGGMSQSKNHRANARLIQKIQGQVNELSSDLLRKSAQVAKDKSDQAMDPKVHNALGGGYMNPLAKHYDTLSQKFSDRAVQVGRKNAVKNIASPATMRKIGMAEAEPVTVEEIAMSNPERPTTETAGKINWERMIKDYMENKPYSEFEFPGDRPLTLYRSQVYAILKDFGRMKPQQKVSIILKMFGDKYAMVDYLDKLRAKGMMPKKVPAYVSPNVEPVPPGQMSFPGMASPKIKEAQAQKKNSNQAELGRDTARSPKVQRAFQLARARQAAAGSDIEAFVKDELEKSEQAQTQLDQLQAENDRQDQQIQQLAAKVRQQDQEINQAQQPTAATPAKAEPPKEKPKAAEPDKKAKAKDAEPKAAEKPAEPARRNEPRAEPAPAKAEKPPKVDQPKPDDTQIQRPRPEPVEVPDNVLQFPTTAQRKKKKKAAAAQVDPMAAAMQGVDMSDMSRAVGMNESSEELHIGDPVIIRGNVEHSGKTGDVAGFGRDKHFVIVDLYNFGKHAFHASNVEYNNHDDYIDENQRMDKFNIAQPIPGGSNKQREAFLDARDRLFRQMQSASPGEKEAIRLKIAELEGRAQSQGIRIRENNLDEFVTPQAVAQDPSLEREKDVDVVVFGRIPQDFHAEQLVDALEELLPAEYPPGGDWRHQDRSQHGPAPRKMFEVLKQGGAVVTTKPLSVAKKLVAAFNAYGIKSRIDSPGVTEADDLNRSGYNAIKTVGDWAEKMRVMRELQKDIALMSDPEAKAAVQQRIGDLLKVGIKQGYIKEALNDKAMAVLRGLKNQTQATQSTALNPAQQAEVDAWAQDFQRNVAGPMGRQIVPVPAQAPIDLNVPDTPKARRGRPSNAERAQRHQEFLDIKRRLDQLNELIRIKEQIDKLFIKAQNVRGGIYPGLRSDIEAEELYPVPETDQQFQDLLAKYTKDLAALQKFLAMKKAVYREDEDSMLGESSALVRLKQARQALSQQGLNEFAPGQGGGGSGDYFQALASAWYNGAFDTGSLQKGIKSKEDVERLLNRGIIGPDGVTRKYAIDYNSDFDGVVISSDDYYEHSDYNDQGQEVDSRNGQPWGPNDYMEFSDDDLSESQDVNEFAPAGRDPWGDDDRGEDPYGRPQPKHYNRSIDFFGQFEADHFDREDVDNATGVFKGYWGDDQIAYFKFDNPQRNGSDDPGMGWYYEPQNEGVAEAPTDYQKRRQRERDVDAGRPVKPLPKNPQTDYAKKRAKDRRDQELGEKKDNSPGKITKSEDPCWTGYHMVGKKKKNGREVPNCVPGKKG